MSQQITLQISEEVARRATAVAAQTERSVEDVLAIWLDEFMLEIGTSLRDTIVNATPVDELPDSEVMRLTQSQLTEQQQEALSHLLTLNRESAIDAQGRQQLEELMRLYERGLLRKSQALRVAVNRGLIAPLES